MVEFIAGRWLDFEDVSAVIFAVSQGFWRPIFNWGHPPY
jgi:hypothetical protein